MVMKSIKNGLGLNLTKCFDLQAELTALRAELENQNRFLGLVIVERDQLQQRLDAAERELEHVKTVEFPKKAEAVAKANRLAALQECKEIAAGAEDHVNPRWIEAAIEDLIDREPPRLEAGI